MKPERDIYFQKALEEGYLARSAYKLLQIDEVFNVFKDVTKAIDLCSAPGSWTQVICNKLHKVENYYNPSKLNPNVKIVSVDMMPMDHFPGAVHLQADISQYTTMKTILEQFDNEKADIIVCDGAIDVVGMKMIDYFMHHRIFLAALYIVLNVLKTGGTFIMKIFVDKSHEKIIRKLNIFFRHVCIVKPHCSRNKEAFAVCQDFLPLPEFDPIQLTPFIELKNNDFSKLTGIHKKLIPYLCGDCNLWWDAENTSFRQNEKSRQDKDDIFDMLTTISKDVQDDILTLNKRVSQKYPVYQITQDNQLEYDSETAKELFQGFVSHTITCKDKSVVVEEEQKLESSTSSSDNKNPIGVLETNFNEFEEKETNRNETLGEKIKTLENQHKGKYPGPGFNLDNWEFFVPDVSKYAKDITENEELKCIYEKFDETNESLKNKMKVPTSAYIKELFMKQEEIKSKIRNYIFEHDKDKDVS